MCIKYSKMIGYVRYLHFWYKHISLQKYMKMRNLHIPIQYLEKKVMIWEISLCERHKLTQSWKPEAFQEAIFRTREIMLSKASETVKYSGINNIKMSYEYHKQDWMKFE